jgi:hypothetical protein
MFMKAFPLMVAAVALAGCGVFGGGAPGKAEVQKGMEELAKEVPILFGTDKPVVKDAKCTKVAKDMYDCVVQLATSSAPDQPLTQNVKLTKLSGKWHAQMNALGGLGG